MGKGPLVMARVRQNSIFTSEPYLLFYLWQINLHGLTSQKRKGANILQDIPDYTKKVLIVHSLRQLLAKKEDHSMLLSLRVWQYNNNTLLL